MMCWLALESGTPIQLPTPGGWFWRSLGTIRGGLFHCGSDSDADAFRKMPVNPKVFRRNVRMRTFSLSSRAKKIGKLGLSYAAGPMRRPDRGNTFCRPRSTNWSKRPRPAAGALEMPPWSPPVIAMVCARSRSPTWNGRKLSSADWSNCMSGASRGHTERSSDLWRRIAHANAAAQGQPGYVICVHDRTRDAVHRRWQADQDNRFACQAGDADPRPYAPALLRLRPRQSRGGYQKHPVLARARVDHSHDPIHCTQLRSVRRLLSRLKAPSAAKLRAVR
jgi:hypothetical protein